MYINRGNERALHLCMYISFITDSAGKKKALVVQTNATHQYPLNDAFFPWPFFQPTFLTLRSTLSC